MSANLALFMADLWCRGEYQGPFVTSKHFLPFLSKSLQGRIINISSDFASIADNTGGNASYRISKCALN